LKDGDGQVAGELWDVDDDDVARLDEFEGDDYRRVRVTLDDGSTVFAYVGRRQGT